MTNYVHELMEGFPVVDCLRPKELFCIHASDDTPCEECKYGYVYND